MKILITGGKGMLGRTLRQELAEHEIVVADIPEWDVTDDVALLTKVVEAKPDVIVHCAAMTNVDECEMNREQAFRLNEDGARNVALAAKTCGARLIAVSTGYVFSGEPPREPWAWGELDIPRPHTVYGASRFAGERMIQMIMPEAVILRVDWLYGAGGPSFVHAMARLGAQKGEPIKVVDDRRGNPTSAKTIADVIRFLLTKPDVSGIVHGTCEDQCTRYELACEVKRLLNGKSQISDFSSQMSGAQIAGAQIARQGGLVFRREIVPCTMEELPQLTPRPRNLALKKSVLNLLGYRTPNWKKALADFVWSEF